MKREFNVECTIGPPQVRDRDRVRVTSYEFNVECTIGPPQAAYPTPTPTPHPHPHPHPNPPQVAYREAITKAATIDYTHKKQSGGSGQFAKIQVKFEPLETEEGAAAFEFAQELTLTLALALTLTRTLTLTLASTLTLTLTLASTLTLTLP